MQILYEFLPVTTWRCKRDPLLRDPLFCTFHTPCLRACGDISKDIIITIEKKQKKRDRKLARVAYLKVLHYILTRFVIFPAVVLNRSESPMFLCVGVMCDDQVPMIFSFHDLFVSLCW